MTRRGRQTTTTRRCSSTNKYLAWSMRTVVRDDYYDLTSQFKEQVRDQPPRVESPLVRAAAQLCLSISGQVCGNGGERRGRLTTTTQGHSSTNNAYGTATCGVYVRFKGLRDFSFDVLPSSERGISEKRKRLRQRLCGRQGGGDKLLRPEVAAQRTSTRLESP
jgi:hypothetical protein